jgi:acyl-CoA synthetase (AMP-forming)/AMP-acid ligase II
MLVLAIVGAGGIYTGTNPSYTVMELAHHFKASDAKFVISEPEILAPVLAAVRERGIPEANVLIFDVLGQEVPAGRRSWKDLFNHGEEDWMAFNNLQRAREITAARLFSSGTTGLPKAVTITHHNLIAQHELCFEVHPRPYQVSYPPAIRRAQLMNHRLPASSQSPSSTPRPPPRHTSALSSPVTRST